MSRSAGTKIAVEKMGILAAAAIHSLFNPQGDTYFVDSVNGNDGNDGESPRHALATLARAVALAAAGDNIILNPGGSETLTAALTVSTARLRIICPTRNPANGYALIGVGTIDLLAITGADVLVYGVKCTPTGATHNQSGITVSAAADRATLINCLVDASAIVTTFNGTGIEITGGADDVCVEDCVFLDCQYGVRFIASGTNQTLRPHLKVCKFYVGKSAAFGIEATPGTGGVRGLIVQDCHFIEGNGDGSAATAAWDGTNGANATQGPIALGANVDQFVITGCRAYTALSANFTNIQAINAGAAGKLVDNSDGYAETADVKTDSVGVQVSTADSKVVVVSTAISNADSKVASTAALLSIAVSTADSKVVAKGDSVGTQASTVQSQTTVVSTGVSTLTNKEDSVGTQVSTVQSTGTLASTSISTVNSRTVVISTAASDVDSKAVVISTASSNVDSKAVVVSTAVSSVNSQGVVISSATSNVDSKAVVISTAVSSVNSQGVVISSATSNVDSKAVVISTAVSGSVSTTQSVGTTATTNTQNISTVDSKVVTLSTAISTCVSHAIA